MSHKSMSSKERITATIRRQPVDHLPLCFEGLGHPWPAFLVKRYPDVFQRVQHQLGLGLDVGVVVQPPRFSLEEFELNERTRPYPDMEVDSAVFADPPLGIDPGYQVKAWTEHPAGESHPLLIKKYSTTKGDLRQVVRQHEYPYESVSLTNDLNIPSVRSVEYLVKGANDLDKLTCILRPPYGKQLDAYYSRIKEARDFCGRHGVLLTGRSQGVADMMFWLAGAENVLLMAMDDPTAMQQFVDIVAAHNMERIRIQLDAGVDHIIRRGWYEATDFWSPTLYRQFLLPPMEREIEAVHAAGATFTYSMNSGVTPLLPMFRELQFDVLGNVDPLIPGGDMARAKREIGDVITLYGGVNNYSIIEQGSIDDVRTATFAAVETMGKTGYILGPGDTLDCLLEYGPTTERNFHAMIAAWKECR